MPWGQFSIRTGCHLQVVPGQLALPKRWLAPMTWVHVPNTVPGISQLNVEPKPNQPLQNPNQPVYARVDSGPYRGSSGFVPMSVFHVPAPPAQLPNAIPMYGMAMQTGQVWEGRCQHCSEIPALHILPSTPTTAADVAALRLALLNTQLPQQIQGDRIVANLVNQKAFMIGALRVRGAPVVYVGHSGQTNSTFFQNVVANLANHVCCPAIQVGIDPILNRRYELATNGSGTDYIQQFDYQCAGPRVIQEALRQNDYPIAMTEIYVGGPSDGQIIRSCGRCRQTVPFMLCPE